MREFFYKIYDPAGNYLGMQTDIIERWPSFSWDVNGGLGA